MNPSIAMASRSVEAPSVVVAVPAHDEAGTIARCVEALISAARFAKQASAVKHVVVVIAAHRCSDDTARLAAAAMEGSQDGSVIAVDARLDVGAVRDLAVRLGLSRLPGVPREQWVLSTDADTVVPESWIAQALSEAHDAHAVCVAGLTEIDSWSGSASALEAYHSILADKMCVEPDGTLSHRHVYGANLAVRADIYLAVGGFPASGHGEDQRLVDAIDAHGCQVLRSRTLSVVTSGRVRGRARNGLAALLRELDDAAKLRPSNAVVTVSYH